MRRGATCQTVAVLSCRYAGRMRAVSYRVSKLNIAPTKRASTVLEMLTTLYGMERSGNRTGTRTQSVYNSRGWP